MRQLVTLSLAITAPTRADAGRAMNNGFRR
jgi:hypothetical protein